LFTVAAALVIGESWRSSRNTNKRRVSVDDQLDELSQKVEDLRLDVQAVVNVWEEKWEEERKR
jgi:optic atrophy 3 protein